MDKNFKDIFNSSEIELPGGLRQAVLMRIEEEKIKNVARKRLFIRIGFAISGISSVATLVIVGKEIASSEFVSVASVGLSDFRVLGNIWQDYALSLLETLPTVSIVATLLPIFVLMLLIKQYAKLENYPKLKTSHMSFRV